MIGIISAGGYAGQAICNQLRLEKIPFVPVGRKDYGFTDFTALRKYLKEEYSGLKTLVNCAGFEARPETVSVEGYKAETLVGYGAALVMAAVCESLGISFVQITTGSIFSGGKVRRLSTGAITVHRNLMSPDVAEIMTSGDAEILGFIETDRPNFTFHNPPCNFFSGVKAMTEENLLGFPNVRIFRLRFPFSHISEPKNYLAKVVSEYQKIYNNVNSMTRIEDFGLAAVSLIRQNSPPGVYNIVNPGYVFTEQIVDMVMEILKPNRTFRYWESEDEFRSLVKAPTSACVLDSVKLPRHDIHLPPIEEALRDCLTKWQPKAVAR